MRMTPLTEESSRQSGMPLSPPPALSTQQTQQPTAEQVDSAPVEVEPRPNRNVLRRTSLAALNRFGRNRASTVTGAAPTLSAVEERRENEYGSQVVDVLDVIGKAINILLPS